MFLVPVKQWEVQRCFVCVTGLPQASKQMLVALHKKATIHQVITLLATSKMSYFQVITTGADDLTLWLSPDRQCQHWWLAGGCDLEIGYF